LALRRVVVPNRNACTHQGMVVDICGLGGRGDTGTLQWCSSTAIACARTAAGGRSAAGIWALPLPTL